MCSAVGTDGWKSPSFDRVQGDLLAGEGTEVGLDGLPLGLLAPDDELPFHLGIVREQVELPAASGIGAYHGD